VPIKDRLDVRELADDVQIVYERSSAHPIAYAITLRVRRAGSWRTVHLYDNAHGVEEHHEHRYVGDVKQPPRIRRGPVNAAMAAAMQSLEAQWPELVRTWESAP
jgi:hypothetical protein